MNKKFASHLLLLMVAFIWGTAFVAQSKGTDHVGAFTFNALRSILGGAALIPVVLAADKRKRKTSGESPADNRAMTIKGGIICGVFLFAASTFQQMGIGLTTAGKAGFITALYIVIVPLLGIVFGRRVSLLVWGCVAAAVAGFYLLCVNENFSVLKGDVLVLVCAFLFSLHIIMIDRFNSKGVDGVKMSCIQFFTAASLSFVFMIIFEEPTLENIINARTAILYAGVMSSGVGYTVQILAQRNADPTAATLLMSMESVFAALAGWVILHERLSGKELIGCALVFAAVIAAQFAGGESPQTSSGGLNE